MGETRKKFDADFREGAVQLARETGKSIAQVARDLDINEGTPGNWVKERDGQIAVAAFIAAQREADRIPHTVACRALGVSPSCDYKWASHGPRRILGFTL